MVAVPLPVAQLLQRQHGLVTRNQCRRNGLDDVDIRRFVRSGRWERVAPSVFAIANHRRTWVRSLWIAHLHAGPDSALSHESAGRIRSFRQVPAGLVTVAVRNNHRRALPGTRHRLVRDLAPGHVDDWNGLPVTTPIRTVFDLASVLHVATLRTLVDEAITDSRFSIAQLGAFLDTHRRRGKPGTTALARVLDDLGPGQGLARSELEKLLDAVIRRSGVPTPSHEHPLPGSGAIAGFVDRCWPEARLIVEADGRKWHTRRQQVLKDSTRSFEAQAAGYETTRLLWEHLAHDPENTARLLRSIYEQRVALLGKR